MENVLILVEQWAVNMKIETAWVRNFVATYTEQTKDTWVVRFHMPWKRGFYKFHVDLTKGTVKASRNFLKAYNNFFKLVDLC